MHFSSTVLSQRDKIYKEIDSSGDWREPNYGAMMLFPTLMHSFLIFAILLPFSSAVLSVLGLLPTDCGNGLQFNYYNDKCLGVNIEQIIKDAVAEAVKDDIGLCAGVIRLHFHDCFVRGCDASVLLQSDAINPNPERSAIPNLSLRGFKVIDAVKTAVEESCPNRVSCADILAFAARDCVRILGNFDYIVPAGRLDGKVSVAQDALANLPPPFFGITDLVNNFARKNLNIKDLVVLSAAHSVGIAHCGSFRSRITDPINTTIIDEGYAQKLQIDCPFNNSTVSQDNITANVLDTQWYKNNNNNQVLFFSDWSLRDNITTQALMTGYADALPVIWQLAFGCSMQKMGRIIELPSGQGEIRKTCSAVNVPN